MVYKAKNIDTDKFLDELKNKTDYDYRKEYIEKKEIEKFHEGYRQAIRDVEGMFSCCNYEKKEKTNE